MKRFLRRSSSRSSKDKQSEENKTKYNLPRTAEVRPCEWPCDDFLRAAGIYDDFYELAENIGQYLVPLAAIHAYRNPTSATEPEPEPQLDPPRQPNYQWDPEVIANQWQSGARTSQYDPGYNFGYPPGHPWQ